MSAAYLILPNYKGIRREIETHTIGVGAVNVDTARTEPFARVVDGYLSKADVVMRYIRKNTRERTASP